MRPSKPLRISPVGLRGVVGPGLTAAHAIDFASALGTFLRPGPVVIGRDPRRSGLMLREGVAAALMATGHDVIDLGLVSTPVIQNAIRDLDAAGGVSIGASHNAAEWNALKFFGSQGTYLTTAESGELLDIYHLKKFSYRPFDRLGKLSHRTDAIDRYVDRLAAVYDFERLKRFRVLVDCSNGTSSLVLRKLQARFGLPVILINERLEGEQFAHEPTTSKRIVALQLAPLVVPAGADAGFLFDVDSDRVALATETGEPVSSELVLPLMADYLLPRQTGKLVITNLSTTALVEEIAARHGGKVLRVPVGRQAAIDALAGFPEREIALAGEGTGAVMMPQFRFVYDGIASMLAILSMLAERGMKLSELIASYPKYSILKGQTALPSHRMPRLLMALEARYRDGRLNSADGLRVDWPNRWFHVRVSQTEPIVRVICEQRGDPPHELFRSLMAEVNREAGR